MNPPSKRPIWRPYTQELTAPPPLMIENGKGSFLWTKSGQKIFDGISSWWLTTHGHCHPEIVEAVQRQVGKLDQVVFANWTHEPAEELSELLLELTPPELSCLFFTDNGSTAVEAALKMALQACSQNGFPEKQNFLAFAGGYHGDTVGAMSVSGSSPFNRPYQRTLFKVLSAEHPSSSKATVEEYLRNFESLFESHHPSLAGVIIEPLIQAAGGMIVWPTSALKRIAELCRRHRVYLIFDEVMTGFGRTGKMFAMDRLGITPDLLCLSKGLTGGTLPLAVTLVREEIYQSFLDEGKSRMFFHGHSFTGNPISCSAAVANLKIFRRPEVLRNLEEIEQSHLQNRKALVRELPLLDSRVCGTMMALEVDTREFGYLSDFSNRIFQRALKNDLFVRPLGNIVYLLPPFCSQAKELDTAWQVLKDAILKCLDEN